MITNGFTYIAFLMFLAGGLLAMEKYTKWKVFNWVPPLVWIYVLNMIFCTVGLFDMAETKPAYSGLKNNLLYAMIFVMLLRCDFRKLAKLGPRMIAIFFGGSITLALGTFIGFPIFMNSMGGAEKCWGAVAALYASWVGGSANMAAVAAALPLRRCSGSGHRLLLPVDRPAADGSQDRSQVERNLQGRHLQAGRGRCCCQQGSCC